MIKIPADKFQHMSYCVNTFNTCTSQRVVFIIICGTNLTDACIGHFFSDRCICIDCIGLDPALSGPLKCHINRFISTKWQEQWSSCLNNKLFKIKPTLGVWPSRFRNSRKEEVVLSRLRIGHTYFSHLYILRQEDPPECAACQESYSVRHV